MQISINHSQQHNPSFQLRLDKGFKRAVIAATRNDGELNTAAKLIKEVEGYGDTNSHLSIDRLGCIEIKNSKMKNSIAHLEKDISEISHNPLSYLKSLTEDVIDKAEYFLFKDFVKVNGYEDRPKSALKLLQHNIDTKTFLKFKEYSTKGTSPLDPKPGFEARQNEILNKLG